jgi:hypothetical protein
MNRSGAAIILILVCALSYQALGDEIEVKSLNRPSNGFFVFSPICPDQARRYDKFCRHRQGTSSALGTGHDPGRR